MLSFALHSKITIKKKKCQMPLIDGQQVVRGMVMLIRGLVYCILVVLCAVRSVNFKSTYENSCYDSIRMLVYEKHAGCFSINSL